MPSSGIVYLFTTAGSVTVTSQAALTSPAFAVIVAVPAATAVTTPSSTFAIVSSEDLHVTVPSVALSGATVAVSFSVTPTSRVKSVLSSVTLVTGMDGSAVSERISI